METPEETELLLCLQHKMSAEPTRRARISPTGGISPPSVARVYAEMRLS